MKSKNTKRAWLASVLSIVLCLTMLMGTTFAWFTDSASTGVNKIVAGNLDIKLSYKNANDTDYAEVATTTEDLFVNKDGTAMLWEPGAVSVCYFKLENLGNLAVKYQLKALVNDTVKGADGAALSKVLKTAVVVDDNAIAYTTAAEAIAAAEASNAESILNYSLAADMNGKTDATIPTQYMAMIVYFPDDIGNTVDGELYNRSDVKLETTIQISLNATQNTVESDSFGNQYDAPALFPNEQKAASQAEFSQLVESIKGENADGVDTIYLAAGEYTMFDIYQNWGAYDMSIIGATNADGTPATTITVDQNTSWGISGTVKNITFKDSTNSKIVKFMDGNGLHADVVIDNCVFDGASMQFTGVATVKNSTFKGNGAAWSGIQYSAPGGDILIDNCKFDGYTFTNLQVTDEGAHKDLTVTVKNCKIGALSKNAVDYAEGVTIYVDTVVLENNTFDCDVWTPSFANVTKTNNTTSAGDEVSYKNW